MLERLAPEELFDAARQRLVHKLVNLAVYALARDEDFFEEVELLVVVVNLALDERAYLLARALVRGDVGELSDDGRHLRVDALLDDGDRVGREHLGERGTAPGELVHARRDELAHLKLEAALRDDAAEAVLDEAQDLLECLWRD